MNDGFVVAVHTKTKLLQRVPPHYIDAFPYFELASEAAKKEVQAPVPAKPKHKEGAK